MTGDHGVTTLPHLLWEAAEQAPGQVVVHVREDGSEHVVTFAELREEARRVAGGLLAAGLTPGTCLPLLADDGADFQALFWGALTAGLVPVPLAPQLRRVLPVWELLGRPPLLVDPATAPLLAELPENPQGLTAAGLRGGAAVDRLPEAEPHDVVFLQFSSGSTGDPKGVELTHAGVLANLEQMRTAASLTPQDVVVSWMPYFHDMGLIGNHLAPLAARATQVRLSPSAFAKRPQLWFDVAARHRATLLSAANFALALAVRRVPDEALARLDLSTVRRVLVGAEPISAAVWRDFVRKVGPARLDARAMQPVYGLAEATLAVTFPPPGELAAPVALDRESLSRGRVVEAPAGPGTVELMDVGYPVPGCEVRVVDDAGRPVPDRRVGHIEVSGPQVARGYHRQAEASAATFTDGWLRTGDLGFLRDGRLCVSGRHKDVLFVNGRTFHASDLEAVASATPGLPPGTAAVVGSTDPVTGAERVVVFVQWARPPRSTVDAVLDRVAARIREALGHDDVRVFALPPGAFPRTTSGKLQRGRMRTRFEAGRYPQGRTPTAAQTPRQRADAPTGATPGTSADARPETSPGATGAGGGRVGAAGVPLSRRATEQAVTAAWARVLDRPESRIGPHDRFSALGGSSLRAMQVLAELEDTFGLPLRPSALRDCDTVAALTDHLLHLPAAEPARSAPDAPGGRDDAPPVAHAPGGTGRRGTDPDSTRSGGGGTAAPDDVVITGMACRFPGAATPEAFWQRLAAGHDLVTEVPPDRWPNEQDRAGRWGAWLDEPAAFDAEFFGMTADEARATDPQARLFLELAHEALERAGHAGPRRHGRRIGVFAAVGESGYREVLDRAAPGRLPTAALVGNLPNLVAARVAQYLDLDGPAIAVDTACSSALVALHLARRSIRSGECDLAVVGGVNLHLTPTGYRLLEGTQALSPGGRCRAFSAGADGFVPGEGGAALVLARLGDAHRAGDPVLAVVRGTAVNNDGRSLSLLAPNPQRQREVIARAYADTGPDPSAVSYVEAHGTGTPVGDPIELRSLEHAFPPLPDGRQRLLGSVKTNVGHLLNAAGMPALVKVVLALGHRQLPASLHHDPPLAAVPDGFAVVTDHRAWEAPGPLTAGVNAFGFGGTNAHAVLQEAPPAPHHPPGPAPGPRLLTLSAHSAEALHTAVSDLADRLRDAPDQAEGDVCATVATARDDGPHRLALVTAGDLAGRLAAAPVGTLARHRPRLVFLLPGQGAGLPARSRDLYRAAPEFRRTFDEASEHVGLLHGRSLAAWCLDDVPDADLTRTEIAQPLLVAFGVALARQLGAWGLEPDAVTGHSAGEITAGCVAGALTLADAVAFAAIRGRLMADTRPGAMAAVSGSASRVAELVAGSGGALSVAAFNGPARTVITGEPGPVEAAVATLSAEGAAVRRLAVSRAFHSSLMDPASAPLARAAERLTVRPPGIPLLSTLTGRWQPVLDAEHWQRHARQPVRFGAAVERLLDDGYDTFLELGAGGTLTAPVRAVAAARTPAARPFTAVALPADAGDAGRALLETTGRLWARGAPLRRGATRTGRTRVPLPTYPFQRRTYWPEAAAPAEAPAPAAPARPAPAEPPAPAGPSVPPGPPPVLHRLVWRPAPTTGGTLPREVLLTGPGARTAEGRALADRLTASGTTVHLDADRPAGGEAAPGPPLGATVPDTVVLLAGPTTDLTGPAAAAAAQRLALAAFQDTLALRHPARLLVVTEDVHTTGVPAERPRPAQSLLTGLTLALPEETRGLTADTLDLSSRDTRTDRLHALVQELRAAADPGPARVIAWRAGARLLRSPVAATPQAAAVTAALPPDGTYLITGGTGGMGAALARDLAGRGRPTLVLAGRSAEPPTRLLGELTALGATAHYRPADVSEEADVERLVSALPPLDGVFHAAGVVRPGSTRSRSATDTTRALAAKVGGSQLLSWALQRHGQRPAVCVAFSSIVSVLPGLAGGLGDYAAGNAFLDAFAAAERAAGRPWQSLNFAAVAGTGMGALVGAGAGADAAAGAVRRPGAVAGGTPTLTTASALAALHDACAVDAAQLLVADLRSAQPPALDDGVPPPSPGPGSLTATRTSPGSPASPASRPEAVAVVEPGEGAGAVAAVLRELLAAALDRTAAAVPDDEPFLGMGLDSLAAVDLAKELERRLGRELPSTLFFEYRTVRELAAHLTADAPTRPEDGARAVGSPPAAPADPGTPSAVPTGNTMDVGEPFALTPVQLAFHISGRLHRDVAAFAYVRQTISGPLRADLLEHALGQLAERHPMLRLRMQADGPTPRQWVAPPVPTAEWFLIRDPGEERLVDIEEELCNRLFDLGTEPPVRAVLLRETPDVHQLLLVLHHSAGDGYSLNVLGEELWTLYTALCQGRAAELPPLEADFASFADALTAERASAAFRADRDHWQVALASHGAPARLPHDGAPDAPPAPPLACHQSVIPSPLLAPLRAVAAAHGVSLFHLLLAAYTRCLSRWSGQTEIAVNVARAGREMRLPGIDRIVGPLADTLPVLARVDRDEAVPVLAERLRLAWLESERHARLSSLDLARLRPATAAGRPRSVGTAGFSFARFPAVHTADCPVTVRPTAAATASAATRLGLLCWEEDTRHLRLSWNYPGSLFDRSTVRRLADDFLGELARLAGPHPSPAPAAAEPSALAEAPAGAAGPRPAPAAPLVARLLAQFRATPHAPAVDTADTTLTYAELDRASAALAGRLRARGVAAGDLVGLLTEPGCDAVAGVVGILRAGAGWVPLDAGHPAARLTAQLARTGARALVCHSATRATADSLAVPVTIDVDSTSPGPGSSPDPSPAPDLAPEPSAPDLPWPEAIAYVIFTSGSTGRPKAVPVTHRSLANYLDWALHTFGYHAGDRLAQTASLCFDASVRQLLAPLLVGATVVTVPRELVRDPDLLLDRVESARVTVWSSVPTLWERLLTAAERRVRRGAPPPDLSALRWVHVGGEALPAAQVRRWFDLFGGGRRVANLYGPTETTINATCHVIDSRPGDDVRQLPIGRPVAGTDVRVVAPDGRRCEPDEAGELLIAGIGLSPGYLGEPELTAAAFTERDGRRWYRSGDLVRQRPDGLLDFLGRLDDQVKVRGHRVEPGEIEAALLTHPGVARAAVVHRDDRLTAFVEPDRDLPAPDPVTLRAHLARQLPDYMLPARIHHVPTMPLTDTGKTDRRRLTSPEALPDHPTAQPTPATGPAPSAATDCGTAPRTRTERRLAEVWSALLDVPHVYREDDFFALGGDSLLVLEVFARLEPDFPALPRPTAIYDHGTLAALAATIDATTRRADVRPAPDARPAPGTCPAPDARPAPDAVRAGDGGPAPAPVTPYPLTPTQRGFLLAETLAPGSGSAWLARLRLRGTLRPADFQRAVDLLVTRHPMLRTVFPAGARPPVQQELPPALRLPVDFETLTSPAELEDRVAAERRRRFEPWAWPLLRLRLLTLAPDEHVLVVHAHHLIGDGYSAALLGRELLTAHAALARGETPHLPPLRSTFRDHVELLAAGGAASPAPDLPGGPGRPALPGDPYEPPVLRPRAGQTTATPPADATGANGTPLFRTATLTLDAGQVSALRRLATDAGTTLYAPVLTAYYRTLAARTGRRDLLLGLAVSGRDHGLPDVNRVFGPLASAVAVRPAATTAADADARDAHAVGQPAGFVADLRRVADAAAAARTRHADMPRLPNGVPAGAQFFFTFLHFPASQPPADGPLSLAWDESDTELAPPPLGTDLFLSARPIDGTLRLTLRAAEAAFDTTAFTAFTAALRAQLLAAPTTSTPCSPPVSRGTAANATSDERPTASRAASGPVHGPASGPATARPTGVARSRAAEDSAPASRLDAALVGYLPSPEQLAAVAGLAPDRLPRDALRAALFPGGRPRLLETLTTPLGRSGFVSLPLFADELTAELRDGETLVGRTARAVRHAAELGARCVSLAGMIPAHTGYGFAVLHETGPAVPLTTGHAATTVSVVRTVHAALDATRRKLPELTVAVVGCGSIGSSALALLLSRSPLPPAGLLLCDVAGGRRRMAQLADSLRRSGAATTVETCESDAGLPDAVYRADLVITAVSGGGTLLDVDRLRPGTVVVDDSFPHCVDTARAVARMRRDHDVLVVGGGLLGVDSTTSQVADGLPAIAATGYAERPQLPGTVASCRLESLLHAADPTLPLVRGPVGEASVLAYWEAAEAVEVRAAPLHLLGHTVDLASLAGFPPPETRRHPTGPRGRPAQTGGG